MRVNKSKPRKEVREKKPIEMEESEYEKVITPIEEKSRKSTLEKIEPKKSESISLEEKVKKLEKENKALKAQHQISVSTLSKNELKIIAAIRSESIIQDTDEPKISANRLKKEYRVNRDYYRRSVENLIEQKIISQK